MRFATHLWSAATITALVHSLVYADPQAASGEFPLAVLKAVTEDQSVQQKARYGARHPVETLEFFEVKPGMTVIEGLPGGGWYTRILAPYLGDDGTLIGAHHADEVWQYLRPIRDLEWEAERTERVRTWVERTAADFAASAGVTLLSYQLSKMPEELVETVDRVLLFRMMHNLQEVGDGYVEAAINEAYRALKPGGYAGVVQHRAPESSNDDWANGDAGYLKPSSLIAKFEAAGFELVGQSEINANPKDRPTESDVVWRLPPTLRTSKEGTPEREAMLAIGESDRMTLKFRKPKVGVSAFIDEAR
ncbi:MAG: methyltransferase [Pseudomonadota bacterium]